MCPSVHVRHGRSRWRRTPRTMCRRTTPSGGAPRGRLPVLRRNRRESPRQPSAGAFARRPRTSPCAPGQIRSSSTPQPDRIPTIRFSAPPSRHYACPLDAERQAIESTLPRKPSADTSSARATPRVADWPSPKEPGSDKPCPERQSGRRRLLRASPKVPDHGPRQQAHRDARQDRRPPRGSLVNSTEEAVRDGRPLWFNPNAFNQNDH